jgi:hypothetical protein
MVRMDGSLGLDGSFVNYVIILCCCGAIVYEVRMILVGWTTYWCGTTYWWNTLATSALT